MEIDTQLFYSDMTSDEQNGPGESSLSANLYVNCKGASPAEKARVKEILDRFYSEIRTEIHSINRFL